MSTTETQTTDDSGKARSLKGWDVLVIVAALGALIVLTIYTARHYGADATKAATVLGIVVPAFATIGAAAFGVRVAYGAGQAQGQAEGQAQKQQAVQTAKAEAAELVSEPLETVDRGFQDLLRLVHERAYSPPDSRRLLLGVRAEQLQDDQEGMRVELQPEPVEIEGEQLEELQRSLGELRNVTKALRMS